MDNKTIDSLTLIDFNAITVLTSEEMQAVDQLIVTKLSSKVELINKIASYLISNGGKRLRPLLLILTAKALGDINQHHLTLATVVEFLHTASLLHDDVIDEATLRRGQKAANLVWGNAPTVLAGDFLYANAFQMMTLTENVQVMDLVSKTVATLTEGEVLQLTNCHNPHTSEAQYLEVISCKTAILFKTAAHLAALISNATAEQTQSLINYGLFLGIAFQLIDDALDYQSNAQELGKNIGADLAEGKTTLPLIYAMQHAKPQDAQIIIDAIKTGSADAFEEVYKVVTHTDAIAYTLNKADEYVQKAIEMLACLNDSVYKEALINLAKFSVQRSY